MLKYFWKNLKTTLLGAAGGGALIVDGIKKNDVVKIVGGVAITLLGLFSRDSVDDDAAKVLP